jgi:hypothetical protein
MRREASKDNHRNARDKDLPYFPNCTSLQQQNTLNIRTVDTLNKKIELETIERKKLEKKIKILSNFVGKKRERELTVND